MDPRPVTLEEECRSLGRRIFGSEPGPEVQAAYVEAHAVVFGETSSAALDRNRVLMTAAIRSGCDLEAVEAVLRFRDRTNFLTRKVNLLFYLMEARPDTVPLFVNSRRSRVRAFANLGFHVCRSAVKLLKGILVLRTGPWKVLREENRYP